MEFQEYKQQFDASFAKVKPGDFIREMEALGYRFEDIDALGYNAKDTNHTMDNEDVEQAKFVAWLGENLRWNNTWHHWNDVEGNIFKNDQVYAHYVRNCITEDAFESILFEMGFRDESCGNYVGWIRDAGIPDVIRVCRTDTVKPGKYDISIGNAKPVTVGRCPGDVLDMVTAMCTCRQ